MPKQTAKCCHQDVTIFFRDTNRWKSPSHDSKEPDLVEIISDRDVRNLYDLSICILKIRKKAKDEGRENVYDNLALEKFMDEFTLMIDNISSKKNIKDYISHIMGARFGIDVPVKYQ